MAFNLFPQTDFRQMDLNYVLEVSKQAAANLEEYAADKEQVVATQAAAEQALAAAQQDIETARQAATSASQDAQAATQAAGTATQAAADAEQDAQTASAAAQTALGVQESIPADYSQLSADVDDLKSDLNYRMTAPAGYVLRATDSGHGNEWAMVGTPTDAQAATAINAWLDDHPEATTTVQDGSLTLQKFKDGELPFVTPEQFGAKGNGVHDDTSAIQDAIDTGKNVIFASSIYLVDKIYLKDAVYDFNNSTIVFLSNDSGIFANGTLKTTSAVLSDYSAFDKTINISGCEKGDLIVVTSSDPFNPDRSDYVCGGTSIVTDVENNECVLLEPFVCDIPSESSVSVYLPCKAQIKNVNLDFQIASSAYGINIRFCYGAKCENIRSTTNKNAYQIQIHRSVGCCVGNVFINEVTDVYNYYCVSINDSTNINAYNCFIKSSWHCISVTGCLPCVNTTVENSVLFATDKAGYLDHGNAYNTLVKNCISSGVEVDNCGTVKDCTIIKNNQYSKIAARGNSLRNDCNFVFENIKIKTPLFRTFIEFTTNANSKINTITLKNIDCDFPLNISYPDVNQVQIDRIIIENANIYVGNTSVNYDVFICSNSRLSGGTFVGKKKIELSNCEFFDLAENSDLNFYSENTSLLDVAFPDVRLNVSCRGKTTIKNCGNDKSFIYTNSHDVAVYDSAFKNITGVFSGMNVIVNTVHYNQVMKYNGARYYMNAQGSLVSF